MKSMNKVIISILLVILLAMPLLASCNCDDDDNGDKPTPSGTTPPNVTITIGHITDLTSVSANAMAKIAMAVNDIAKYYNEEGLVPGVTFEVKTYDNQYDPAKDIPGYKYLTDKGADVLFTAVSSTAITLKPNCKKDKIALFCVAPNPESFDPPEWVFAAGQTSVTYEVYMLLDWISKNHWDYEAEGRPPKIGAAFWSESYGDACVAGLKDYAEAHPDKFEWVKGYLTDFKFMWSAEVDGLKDCDYIMPPVPMNQFVKEFTNAGYETTFLGTDAHIAFLDMIEKENLWESLDGMLLTKPAEWWTDDEPVINMTKEMLQRYHPDDQESIIQGGIGYLTTQQLYVMMELIKAVCADVGPENFSSEALYNYVNEKGFSIEVDGCPHSFGPGKVTSSDGLFVYEVDASAPEFVDKIHRADPSWLPVIYSP